MKVKSPKVTNKKKITGKRITGALKLIPVIGDVIEYLLSNWGVKYTLFAFIGFLIGWSVIGLGYAPDFIITRYKGLPPSLPLGSKPTQMPVEQVSLPDWLQPYSSWLENEGHRMKDVNAIRDFMVQSFQAQEFLKPGYASPEFDWVVEVPKNYEISGRAFKIKKTNSEESAQPLEVVKDDASSIRFLVPKCKEGDKLITILITTWKQDPPPASFQSIIRTKVK